VRNVSGYSATTGKHIAYTPHTTIDAKLWRNDPMTAEGVRDALTRELETLTKKEAETKRKGTQKHNAMTARIERVKSSIELLTTSKEGNA
jgi:hypothetical protein